MPVLGAPGEYGAAAALASAAALVLAAPTARRRVALAVVLPTVLLTLALLTLVKHWRAQSIVYRGVVLFLGSALIYALELAVGIQLWVAPGNRGSLDGLLELILGAYAIGLGRAWELLGAPRSGFVSTVAGLIRPRTGPKPKP